MMSLDTLVSERITQNCVQFPLTVQRERRARNVRALSNSGAKFYRQKP